MILRDHVTTINQKIGNTESKIGILFRSRRSYCEYCQTTQDSKIHTSTCSRSEFNLGVWRDLIWSSVLVRARTTGINLQTTKTVDVPDSRKFQRHTFTGFELCWLLSLPWGISHESQMRRHPVADQDLLCQLSWKSERNSRRYSSKRSQNRYEPWVCRIHIFGVGLAESRGLLHFSKPFVIETEPYMYVTVRMWT